MLLIIKLRYILFINEEPSIKRRIFLHQTHQTQEINHKNPLNSENHISLLSRSPNIQNLTITHTKKDRSFPKAKSLEQRQKHDIGRLHL